MAAEFSQGVPEGLTNRHPETRMLPELCARLDEGGSGWAHYGHVGYFLLVTERQWGRTGALRWWLLASSTFWLRSNRLECFAEAPDAHQLIVYTIKGSVSLK